MKWLKIKHIFSPEDHFDWMVSHAANPFAEKIAKGIYRIYFTCRNAFNESHIGYVDVDLENEFNVTGISDRPLLQPGEPGMFDDSGVAMSCLITVSGQKYLYYLGWNLKIKVPWLNTIGLAVWDEKDQLFKKHGRAPVMDRSNEDPFSISYPFIIFENEKYKMWYGSNLKWGSTQYDMQHVIKYAESKDGIHWKRSDKIHVNLVHPNEYALSKPCVIKDKNIYRMFYSYRANGDISSYRIGFAESSDGENWVRKDELAGIDVSENGWDADMICYPFVFSYKDKTYMLYNGNGFGKTGFGIAQLIE